MNESNSVGSVMGESKTRAIKALVLFASMLVYLAMLLYSGVYNWSLMSKGVPPDLLIWAGLGVVALEISAVFLPLALHFWTHAPLQRFAALGFYAVDLALIMFNVILDYGEISGGFIPGWLGIYLAYGVPSTPIIAGLGWSVLWLLDPSQKERATVETLRASTKEVLAARIAEQAKTADISLLIDQAAAQLAREVIGSTLGQSLPDRKAIPSKVEQEKPARSITIDGINLDKLPEVVKLLRSNGNHPAVRVFESDAGDFLADQDQEGQE